MKINDKLKYIAQKYGARPEWLYAMIWHESRWNPEATNYLGCVGLIQFCPSTARDLGYEPWQIQQMSVSQQLDLVDKFLQRNVPKDEKLNKPYKVFLAVFYPAALKYNRYKNNNWIIGSDKSLEYAKIITKQNPGLDVDHNGYITIGDIKKYTRKVLWQLKIVDISQTAIIIGIIIAIALFLSGTIKIEK